MATIILSFRRDFPIGCGFNAVKFSYNQTFSEEDEYEPQPGIDYIDEDDDVQQVASEDTNVAAMKEDEDVEVFDEDEDEDETQWGIDDCDDDDDVQEVERFKSNKVERVDAMTHNKIEGIYEGDTKVFFQDNSVNDNGFRYVTGDEGFQDVYSDYLFMVSEQEDCFLSDFGNGIGNCGDDHKDENDINNEPDLKRRKISAGEDCSDGRHQALETRKDGQGEIVLALAAPQFCPWIDRKGILKKHRQRPKMKSSFITIGFC